MRNYALLVLLIPGISQAMGLTKSNKFKDIITKALDIDKVQPLDELPRNFKRYAEMNNEDFEIDPHELQHIYTLERMQKAAEFITSKTEFSRSNSSNSIALHWASAALLGAKGDGQALKNWRMLEGKTVSPFWKEYQKLTHLTKDQIKDLYKTVKAFDENSEQVIIPALAQRIFGCQDYSHRWCDRYEAEQKGHYMRTLSYLRKSGLTVNLYKDKAANLKNMMAYSGKPLTELAKNKRVIEVNELQNSKISQFIHDSLDHYWTYDLLQKEGIFNKYKEFMHQVGNPQDTDIFNREGELVASIMYDFRYTSWPYFDHPIIVNEKDLKNLLLDAQLASQNQVDAYAILEKRAQDKDFNKVLSVVASGVYTELMQQRPKFGIIRLLDKKSEVIGTLATLNPEYLALIIETTDLFMRNKGKIHKYLINSQLIMENFLQDSLNKEGKKQTLKINKESIEKLDYTTLKLPKTTIEWIKNNPAAITDRNQIQ